MQDYKPLCAAVMICATLVNTQTGRQHFDRLIRITQPAELKINKTSKLKQKAINTRNPKKSQVRIIIQVWVKMCDWIFCQDNQVPGLVKKSLCPCGHPYSV